MPLLAGGQGSAATPCRNCHTTLGLVAVPRQHFGLSSASSSIGLRPIMSVRTRWRGAAKIFVKRSTGLPRAQSPRAR
eukprot:6658427-Heterocapsa_arctica.AAC.1